MCGICGVLGKSDREAVERMLSAIVHRGKDDEYLLSGQDYSMGARRLSIIDLKGGRQPLTNEDRTVCVCQNGEIYNYPELMEQLIKSGHIFKTNCDTEVIVHMYEEFGEKFAERLNGMFAVALWDDRKKRGLLIRDRMGEKPLYYLSHTGFLYFASEIKSLLTLPFVKKEINLEALHHYLSYKHVPSPMTIFNGIRVLQPAQYLVYEKGNYMTDHYWHLSYGGIENLAEDEIVSELLRLLKQGIRRRLVSDVPVGIFLSGGMDSNLVTALASELSNKPVETFTLTYPNEIASEGKKTDQRNARQIANQYGTNHHEEMVEINSFPEIFPKIIGCFGQPFSGVVSTYFLAKALRKYVKVGMTGDGADELFGSYLSHRLASDTMFLANLDEGERDDWLWRSKLFVFSEGEKSNLYSSELMPETRQYNSVEHLKQYFDGLDSADPLNRVLGAEFKGIFPDQVLDYADKLSMAHTLELRAAYLDHEFVEFAAGISGDWKIRDGVTKYILKRAAERYLPTEITNRVKEGFLLPITEWYYYNLRGYVEDTLSKPNLNKHGLFNADYVQQLITDFYNRRYDYMRGNKLHSLVAFQVWYNLYIGNQRNV